MIEYSIDDDGIATILWDMPGRTMNVMDPGSMAAFADAVRKSIADAAVRGVIITSGKKDFIAGADLEMIMSLPADDPGPATELAASQQKVFREIETGGKPFVAALPGTTLGGGLEIALACHHRIISDRAAARVGLPEVKLGLLSAGGGTQRVPRMLGLRRGLDFLLEGRAYDPRKSLELGIVDKVVAGDRLLAEAKRWIEEQGDCVKPWDKPGYEVPGGNVGSADGDAAIEQAVVNWRKRTMGNLLAIDINIAAVREGLAVPYDEGSKIEARYFGQLLAGPQARNIIRTMFFSIGDANKLKRRPPGIAKSECKKIGVLGAGAMGGGIAIVSAQAGIDVVLIDTSLDLAEKARKRAAAICEKLVSRGRMTPGQREQTINRIHPATDYAELRGCDIIVEAVFEDQALKADVTKRAEAVIADTTLFGTNTSTFPIGELANTSARPKNYIGLHFFSPVDRMPLVEVIVGKQTSDSCLARSLDFIRRIGKTPIVVNDRRGFYTSRSFMTYPLEGFAMLTEGVDPALVDKAGQLAGMPMGPLTLADEVSIETFHKIRQQYVTGLGKSYVEHPGEGVPGLMVNQLGRTGKGAGKGFYEYGTNGKKLLWPGLAKEFPAAAQQPDIEHLRKRMLYAQAVEAARCMDEEVVTTPGEADIGSVMGWGFPAFTGGVISLIDSVGLAGFVEACDALAERHGPRFSPPNLLRDMAAKGTRFYPKG